jgi:hypothetical protein
VYMGGLVVLRLQPCGPLVMQQVGMRALVAPQVEMSEEADGARVKCGRRKG